MGRPAVVNDARFFAGVALAAALSAAPASAQNAPEVTVSHGLSAFGDLRYPADFAHFDYVNPNAPRGGRIVTRAVAGPRTFDTFNRFIVRGDAAYGSDFLLFDTLMARAFDEPEALYGLVAETVETPEDRSFVIFNLRAEARFADGSPLTADDVAFSIQALRDQGNPLFAAPLSAVSEITVESPQRIRIDFREGVATRDLPLFVAQNVPIFSAAYFEGRDFTAPIRGEAPLSSGPYRVGDYRPGVFVRYHRRDDYWARDLPVNVGQWNFDEIEIRYYTDSQLLLEAFKVGDIDLTEEFRSATWATEYDFPAIDQGHVTVEQLEDGRAAGTQGFWFNARRPQFADPRVRQALATVFDFEWTNERLFYNLYTRTDSFFENSPVYQAEGPPSPAEVALLEPFRDQLPPSVFADPAYTPPVSNGSGRDRSMLRDAGRLLDEAGWTVVEGMRRNAAGDTLSVEFLDIAGAGLERIINPYIENLRRLGVDARLRSVDTVQFAERTRNFDYDVVVRRFAFGETPGASLVGALSSTAAGSPGSFNLAGVSSPVIDALLERIVAARSREELITAAHALDRVFRASHYWTPNWYNTSHNIAYWNRFGRPQDLGLAKPRFNRGILRTWWVDPERAAAIDAVR